MILTVTLNPALDKTYTVDALVPNGSHRGFTVLAAALHFSAVALVVRG